MKNIIYFTFILIVMTCGWQKVGAYELKSLDDPFLVISGGLLKFGDVEIGTDFHAMLGETVEFNGMSIPEGTEFIGHVGDISEGSIFICPNLDVWIDQVVFPNGKKYIIYPHEQTSSHVRLKLHRWKDQAQSNWVDAGESIQIKFRPLVLKGLLDRGQGS